MNVVAIVPKNVKTDAVTESDDAVILRAPDAATATELRKRLMASANQMAAVAGLLEVSPNMRRMCRARGLPLTATTAAQA